MKNQDHTSANRAVLFEPFSQGALSLKNRLVMSPMTRARTGPDGVPTPDMATYYAQRAEAGLIIAEATRVSPQATGYVNTPGIFTPEQVSGWRKVTEAVHAQEGKIFCQLWHVGRVSHDFFHPDGEQPVAPSAITAPTQVFGPEGMIEASAPRALKTAEIPGVVEDFRSAAQRAQEAGFDGVEIHAANGYLIHQFCSAEANQRSDQYGGSLANRLRFLYEIVEAVSSVWSSDHISVRIGPQMPIPGIGDNNSWDLYAEMATGLHERSVGLFHIGEFTGDHPMLPPGSGAKERWAPRLKDLFGGTVIINGGLSADTAATELNGYADLAAFGIPFLANPDLPTRLRLGVSLNRPQPDRFYGGGPRGYLDYPRWQDTLGAKLAGTTADFLAGLDQATTTRITHLMQRVDALNLSQHPLAVGAQAPDFELQASSGETVSLSEARARGFVLLSFYRGAWCPYCNLELNALKEYLPQIQAAGGQLIAISPERSEFTNETENKLEVAFPVLSDPGSQVAEKYGLAFTVDAELFALYQEFGINLEERNGDSSGRLAIPASYLIDRDGIIRYAHADADYTHRAEPHEILHAISQLSTED